MLNISVGRPECVRKLIITNQFLSSFLVWRSLEPGISDELKGGVIISNLIWDDLMEYITDDGTNLFPKPYCFGTTSSLPPRVRSDPNNKITSFVFPGLLSQLTQTGERKSERERERLNHESSSSFADCIIAQLYADN